MDLDGVLQNDLPSKCKLTTSQIDQIKNFVFNNKYVLSMLADSKILVKDVSSIWIKGGKKVSADTIKSLNDKIDELCKKDGSKKNSLNYWIIICNEMRLLPERNHDKE